MKYLQNSGKNIIFLLLLMISISLAFSVNAQDKVTQKEAKQWMQSGAWRKGISLKPHASINAVIFYKQYHNHKKWWDKALDFLKRKDLASLADGSYPIVGKKVFASVSSYVPVRKKEKQWEAHRKYADIQMVISGKEKIGKTDASQLKITRPYSNEKDSENLKGHGKIYLARPGTFFIFFPGDAHKPGLKANKKQDKKIKKLVIKVRAD